MTERFIRLPELLTIVGVSRWTIGRLERAGHFPRRVRLPGGRAVGWLESQINEYLTTLRKHHEERDAAPAPQAP